MSEQERSRGDVAFHANVTGRTVRRNARRVDRITLGASKASGLSRYWHAIRNRLIEALRMDAQPVSCAGSAESAQGQSAVHRAIVVIDVKGFGDVRRTDANRLAVRRSLYKIVEQVFRKVEIDWDECDCEDRGDGVLILVPPSFTKSTLVASLPTELRVALQIHNRVSCPEEQIRLRMSVHAGEIHYDEYGVVGQAVNVAFRLLDAQVLREVLAQSLDPLVIIASSWFFDEVIWHIHMADPDAYQQVRVQSKETDVTAWVRLLTD